MSIPHPMSLVALTGSFTGVAVGALGERFSACPTIVGGVAVITSAGAANGVHTDGVVKILLGC